MCCRQDPVLLWIWSVMLACSIQVWYTFAVGKNPQEWCLKGNDVKLYGTSLSEVEMPEKLMSEYIFDLVAPGSLYGHRRENGTLRVWFLTWVPSGFPWNMLADSCWPEGHRPYGELRCEYLPVPGNWSSPLVLGLSAIILQCAKNKCTSNIMLSFLKCDRSLLPFIPGLLPEYHPEDSLFGRSFWKSTVILQLFCYICSEKE